ncbi:acylphosphatase [Patescibacteria group bacterium]|nr:acylphosphatase [Patescibacteria group bacterium]
MLCHLVISGFVQGVGYRQFVKKTALSLGLKGWVKNIDQGRVETLFSGQKEVIERAINACRKGPFLANVKDIKIEWENKEMNFNSFEISV